MISYLRNRKKSGLNTKLMSLLLAFTLIGSLFTAVAPTSALAAGSDANIGGTPPATGGATSSTPAGTFQVSDQIAVLQFGFIPNKVNSNGDWSLSPSSGVTDLEDPFKFNYEELMFYMAPNEVTDNIWRKSSSGLISFERGIGVKTLYGNNPLYPSNPRGKSHSELMKRTLDHADLARNTRGNTLVSVIGDVLYKIDPNNPNRSLAGLGSNHTVGDSLRSMIQDYIINRSDADELSAQIASDMMMWGYLDLIKERGILSGDEYKAFEQMMKEKQKNNEIIFFAQTIVGISVQDGGNPLSRDYAFISMHDATDWYLNTRQLARPNDSLLQELTANREYEAVTLGGATTGEQGSLSPYKENGNIPFSFRTYARDYYARTLKPVTDGVPISDNSSVNPFGGWGFQPWMGSGDRNAANTPSIDVQLEITVIDKDGNPTNEVITVPVQGWSVESNRSLVDLSSNSVITGGMVVDYEGTSYEIIPDANARFSLIDKKDNENINKPELTKDAVGEDLTIPVPSAEGSGIWEIELGYDTPLPIDLNMYLGGDATSGSSTVENKYEGTGTYSNAQLTLFVQAREDDPTDETVETGLEVPQWRLSKYWNDISPSDKTLATFNLSLPIETFRNPSLSPSGATFSLINPDLSQTPWAMSEARLFDDTPYRTLSPYNPSAKFNLAGDLLAIKDNDSISNNKFASWVNNISLFDNRIGNTSKGSADGQVTVTKNHQFQFGVKSGVDPFRYTEDKRVPVGSQCSELFGCWTIWGWQPSTANALSNYKTADYDTTVTFQRYIPKDSVAPKTFPSVSESVNGKYWETSQSGDILNVNPEVLMAYDDLSGNTSVAFVAGDRMRQIKPVLYNVAQFVNVDINPSLTGMSTATDATAKTLASKHAPNKEVVYKGSAVTTDFDVKGQLELRTYALDIGNSAYKNLWNPSTTYNTDAINEEFLSRHATKDVDGNWQVTFNAEGKLIIGDKEYGGVTDTVTAKQSNQTVNTYVLEVRSGQLVGVNGNRNLNSLPQDLKDALTRMKIMGTDNIFNTFEHGKGHTLSEKEVADLGNDVRGTSDLSTSKGWYNEDTTILVVREYINTFDLPSFVYVDKIPMEIEGLKTPSDKNEFFTVDKAGYVKMTYRINEAFLTADSSKGELGIKKEPQYVVPNVSVLDTLF